jgi:hypothetical protein
VTANKPFTAVIHILHMGHDDKETVQPVVMQLVAEYESEQRKVPFLLLDPEILNCYIINILW